MIVRRLCLAAMLCASCAGAEEVTAVCGESDVMRWDTRGLCGTMPTGVTAHWGGEMSASETWTKDSVHVVYGRVTLPTNITLTVESGAIVKFVGGGIHALGLLVADGATFTDFADDSVGGDTDGNRDSVPYTSYAIDGNVQAGADTRFRCRDMACGFAQSGDPDVIAFDTRGLCGEVPPRTVAHAGGELLESETWAAGTVHVVYGTLVVPTNVTLTVASGAVVKFAGGGIYALGQLIADGANFTDLADDSVGGDTDGDANGVPYISYFIKGNVEADAGTQFRCRDLSEQLVQDCGTDAFRFDTRGLLGAVPSGTVAHWGGRLEADETWPADATHVVYGTMTFPTNVTLTVASGAVVKFAGGGILAEGPLVAEGAAFTDLDDDSVGGDTRGDGWTQPFASYSIGGDVRDDAATIYRCLDTHYGFLMDGSSGSLAFDTRGFDAAEMDGAREHSGEVSTDETWGADETHVVYGTLSVVAGVTLTIEPGAVVKFVGGGLAVDGLCIARGVTFTDLDDASRGASRTGGKLPYTSYALEGNFETDAATVILCRRGLADGLADAGQSRVFRMETEVEGVRFAGEPREITFSTAWDGSSAVEVTETRPDGSTVVLTNGTAECEGVFLWDAGEAPGLYTLRHVTDTNELTASFYRLFNAVIHSGSISGTNVWAAGVVHVISRSLSVRPGGVLFIEPGAIVKLFPDVTLTVETGGLCVAEDVIFTSIQDISIGGDNLADGGATEPNENDYLVVGYVRESDATEYRYGNHSLNGTIVEDEVWDSHRVYVIDGTLSVATGASLMIPSGTVVKFTSGSVLSINEDATCVAEGVIFTHIADDSAGGDTIGDGDETQPEIGAYTITGLILDDETTQYRYQAPVVMSGTISQSTFWRSRNVYRVTGNLTIASGVTLTIMPGAIVKFDSGKMLTVNSGATLNAIGTRAQPIAFTSVKDDEWGGDTNGDGGKTRPDGGNWTGLYVYGEANLDYCIAMYAAPGNERGNIECKSGGRLTMNGCTVAHSLYDGVWNWGGTIKITNSIFVDCGNAVCPYQGSTECDNCVMFECNYGYMDWSHWVGGTFRNCIFYGMGMNWSDTQGASEFQSHSTIKNCCFYNPESYSKRNCTKDGVDGCLYADPKFVDPDNGDFRIAADSPCVDAGDGTVAPEVDYWNRPRMNVPGEAKKGKPAADGTYPDIGIYEVDGESAKDVANLAAGAVSAPASVVVGEEAEVAWRVVNVGTMQVEGVWQDRVEFVGDNGAAIELATVADFGPVAVSGSVSRTATFVVPALPLKGRIRVVVNADRGVYESVTTNNLAEADGVTRVGYPALAVGGGGSADFEVPESGEVGYQLAAMPSGGLLVIRSGRAVEARLGVGQMPTADIYTSAAVQAEPGVWILRVPAGSETAYVTFSTPAEQLAEVSVSAQEGAVQLLETSLLTAPNSGLVTVPFFGNGFDETIEVSLERNGTRVAASDLSVASAVSASAVFDVEGQGVGIWKLTVRKGASTVSADRVNLTSTKVGPKWSCKLDAASSVRSGRIYTGRIVYANTGDTAMPAPYVHVTAASGTQIRFSTADAWGDSLELMATSESYPASQLKPGEEVKVPFYYQTTGDKVSIRVESAKDDPKAFPWETNGSYMRPSWATDEIWNRAFAILKRNVGATWNDCFDRLNADADHLMKIGTPERRFDRLWQMEVNEALGVDPAVGSLAGGTDLARSGRGFGLAFSRSYGSGLYQRLRKGRLGYGWSDNLSVSCELQENDTRFVIQSGNGGSYAFTKVTGAWKPEDARDKTVLTETGAEWVLTARSGTVIRFSKSKKRLVSVRDNLGNGLDFTHDASGNVTEVKHTDGQWLRFTYAGELLASASDDQGRTVSYAYTGEMLTEVTGYDGLKIGYRYLPTDETATSRALRQIVAADGQTKDFTYDAAGRIATVSRNGTHFTTEIVRGELGSYAVVAPNGGVTEVTVGASGETLSTVNALGQKMARTYTADTLLESVVSPTGRRSKIFYDADGQAVKSLDAAGAATSFAYDDTFGSLKSVTDARQKTIAYGYDKLGRSESVAYPDETRSRLAYAANGDVTNAVNACGESIAYAYDKEGNKIGATWPNGRTFAWTYDAKGNCVSASDSVTGTVMMEYDDKERLTRITYPGGRGFTYDYDAYGRVTVRTSLDGYAQKYEYDAFGRLARMTDGSGNPYVVNTYDPVTGNLVLQTYGNGTTVSNAYDLLDRTISITHRKADGTVLERFAYAYNEDGQRISHTTKEGVERYTYDAAGQVTGVAYPDGTEENFTYDAVGNRLATDEETYTVNALNQYTSVGSRVSRDRDATFTYDLDGNLTSRTSTADGTTTYAYDCEDRLIAVSNTTKGVAWSCEYDVFGNRVRVTDNGVTTEKLYIQSSLPSVAAEYVNGSLVIRHILSGAVRIADIISGEADSRPLVKEGDVHYYHADGLASTRLLTDKDGSISATASYKTFGEIRASSGIAITDGYVGTLGIERDSTGLLFMRNRYYDAAMGRFVQRDPIGLRGGDVNWYRYCVNDGIGYIDPLGTATYCYNVDPGPRGYAINDEVILADGTVFVVDRNGMTPNNIANRLKYSDPENAHEIEISNPAYSRNLRNFQAVAEIGAEGGSHLNALGAGHPADMIGTEIINGIVNSRGRDR